VSPSGASCDALRVRIRDRRASPKRPHSRLRAQAADRQARGRAWQDNGRDAQIILGHSRLAATLEIYTHEDR